MVPWFIVALPWLGRLGGAVPWEEAVDPDMKWPPSQSARGNPVNISVYLTDVHDLNEPAEQIAVYVFIKLWWKDTRWREAMMQRVESHCNTTGCSEAERNHASRWVDSTLNRSLFGQNANAFFESAQNLGKDLPSLEVAGEIWTPIPVHLQLKTSSNPRGITEFDPIIAMTVPETNDFEAIWVDSEKTIFDVTLSYVHYPFDTQLLDLCIPFDYFSDPQFQETLSGPEGSGMPAHIERIATRWDGASDIASIASRSFVKELETKGFAVDSIEARRSDPSLATSSICIKVTMTRRVTILLIRFFWPLTALLFIPFAGFFIPIDMVMPRVATGFVSFLSLQVFRSIAYNMIPKPTSSLLWMDITMFCVTVIMFASVLENVLAQSLRATVSTHAAGFLDEISRISFPLVAVVVLVFLFVLGAAHVDVVWIMAIMFGILAGWLATFGVAVFLYVRWLPHRLVNILIRQISSPDFRYRKALQMDARELAVIFRSFDKDGTGDLSAEELIQGLEARGLRFQKVADEQHFKGRLRRMFRATATETLDLSAFCYHFTQLFSYSADPVEMEADPQLVKEVEEERSSANVYL